MAAADSGRMTPGMLYVLWPMIMTALQRVAMVSSQMGEACDSALDDSCPVLATIATCVRPIHWLEVPITARCHVNLTRLKSVRMTMGAVHQAVMPTMIMTVHLCGNDVVEAGELFATAIVSRHALMAIHVPPTP